MISRISACLPAVAFLLSGRAMGQPAFKAASPEVSRVVSDVSAERIAQNMRKLETFGTRDVHSSTDSPAQGIGAARRWIFEELKSYNRRLEVRFDGYKVKKQGRIQRGLELVNVVAVLPGSTQKERQVIVAAHYDSLALVKQLDGTVDWAASAAAPLAPGVSDDGSGVAAVLELARVMSHREWKKTLVFVLFAGEEQGLFGSRLYADKLKSENAAVDGVLNMDIIGDDTAGNGQKMSHVVRLFSAEPNDSPSRALARYVREMAERYLPSMKVDLVFRADRFARGGDHTPFAERGFAAVRFTEPNENYGHQHTVDDTFAHTSPDYTARVAKVNAAAAACLAMAPRAPVVARGQGLPMLGRGKSGYDAELSWTGRPEPGLAGYSVVIRPTTSPFWEREIFVGDTSRYTLENVSIDDVVIGVKAVGADGFESPVAAYIATDRFEGKIELAESN